MLRRIARPRFAALLAATAMGVALAAAAADARPGRGFSVGSRGARTFQAPAPTATAPRPAQGFDRTVTTPRDVARQAPATAAPARAGPSFGGGLLGGFAAGLLGAGLIGMLTGGGFLSGMAGFIGFLGLLLQLALLAVLAMLLVRFFRGRMQGPAAATAGGYARTGPGPQPAPAAGGPGRGGPMPGPTPVQLLKADFDGFERLLGDVQAAYGRSDVGTIRLRSTPEIAAYFEQELSDAAAQGLKPRISGVKLLQGDLAEAWREGPAEYATVAMRYAIRDEMVDAAGRVVETGPSEATELWTFRREPGDDWKLSAVQQQAR